MTINLTTRAIKGSPLTSAEADANLNNLAAAIEAAVVPTDAATLQSHPASYFQPALGFTPLNATATALNSAQFAGEPPSYFQPALGFTPLNATAQAVDSAQLGGQLPSYYTTTTNIIEGSNEYYTTARTHTDSLTSPLTGLSTVTSTPVTSADTILSAAGKLQAQITAGGVLDGFGVNALSFGAKTNDLTFDQTSNFAAAIAYAAANGIGRVYAPAGKYAMNLVITQSGILLDFSQPQNWYYPTEYLVPWDITKPVIQIGNDSANVYGISLQNVALYGGGPNGTGALGLVLGGGCSGVNIFNFSCMQFGNASGTSYGVEIGNGASVYPIEYVNFTNCNFLGHTGAAYTAVMGVYTGTGSSWTSAIYFANCNLEANTFGKMIILNAGIIWNGGWLQGSTGYGIQFTGTAASGPYITGNCNIEIAGGGDSFDIPETLHPNITSWIGGNIQINSTDQLMTSDSVLHSINQPGNEIGYGTHYLGKQFYTGYTTSDGAAPTDSTMYISGGYDTTGSFDIVNNNGTSGKMRLGYDGSFNVIANGGTQFKVANVASATNYATVQGSTGTNDVAIYLTGSGNVNMELSALGTGLVKASNYPVLTTSDTITTHTTAAPTGTASTTAVMMAAGTTITPSRSTRVLVTVCGMIANSTAGDGATVDLRISGTTGQTAPVNGAAVTGTLLGLALGPVLSTAAAQKTPFSITAVATGLTAGGAYWVDASLMAVTGGTATITNVSVTITEV